MAEPIDYVKQLDHLALQLGMKLTYSSDEKQNINGFILGNEKFLEGLIGRQIRYKQKIESLKEILSELQQDKQYLKEIKRLKSKGALKELLTAIEEFQI